MIPVLSNRPGRLELNALFIQPTRWCGLNCKNCYVKDHQGGENSHHIDWWELHRLFNLFYKGPHWSNQITISVDNLHKDAGKAKHMLLVVDSILEVLRNNTGPKSEQPEVHMTLHTVHTMDQYVDTGVQGFDKLNTLSFSELNPDSQDSRSKIKQLQSAGVLVNYNYMPPAVGNKSKAAEHITKCAELVDHIYLVMRKHPVGGSRGNLTTRIDQIYMDSYMMYISSVIDTLPGDVRSKITTDSCLSDTIKYTRTGFGCSSNISKFQVWPDGSVSGCPYAFSGITEVGITAENIVGNIYAAKKHYEFRERCHLPSVFASLTKRSRLRVLES